MLELARLEAALAGVRLHLAERPNLRALQSAVEQLEYLIAYAKGGNDGAALGRINIGIIAVKEIEDADLELAMKIYAIQHNADRLAKGAGGA